MKCTRVAVLSAVTALAGCGGPLGALLPGPGGFNGTIDGKPFVYEPTGTVFSFIDTLTGTDLRPRGEDNERMIVVGSFAYFDPAQDANRLSGSDIAELRHEVENNDWIVIERSKADLDGDIGRSFTAVLTRDTPDNTYRLQDTGAPEASPDFAVRVRFGREALTRNAGYDCTGVQLFPCQPYRPMGSKITAKVTFTEINLQSGGNVAADVVLTVERRDGVDPNDALTGTITGAVRGTLVQERTAETNMNALDLYELTGLEP